jgi:phosphoribosyl 1,2-cyclic phosphodiesterase
MEPVVSGPLALLSLASGSSGNATYIGDDRSGVLVDAGIAATRLLERLDGAGFNDAVIHAVLITHEHTDHVGGAAVLERRLARRGQHPVFFATAETWERTPSQALPSRREVVPVARPLHLGPWTVEAHAVPHDTPAPVAWTVERAGHRAGVLTDLGHTPDRILQLATTLDVAAIELNHDVERLMDGPYPWPLKQRIRGRLGHLSNLDGARLLRHAAQGRLRQAVLAHLSEQNNTPELALAAAYTALAEGRCTLHVEVGSRERATGPLIASQTTSVPPPDSVRLSQPSLFDR